MNKNNNYNKKNNKQTFQDTQLTKNRHEGTRGDAEPSLSSIHMLTANA